MISQSMLWRTIGRLLALGPIAGGGCSVRPIGPDEDDGVVNVAAAWFPGFLAKADTDAGPAKGP